MINVIRKRIMAELRMFYEEGYIFYGTPFNWYSNKSENIITIYYDNDEYQFKLLKTYPFTPPILYVNNIECIKLLHNYWNLFKMNSIPGNTCICETTSLCGNNWSPCINIEIILKEIYSFKSYFKILYKLKYIAPILKKYNIFENAINDKIKKYILIA